MASWLARCCGRTPPRPDGNDGGDDQDDLLLWSNSLMPHYVGELSAAIVQANLLVEDQLQVETFRCARFVGVYDGHGGDDCSTYVAQRLFKNFLRDSDKYFLYPPKMKPLSFSSSQRLPRLLSILE
ncbi:putative protein phosphatase 2C 43 [Nymphaea thermarum]|nr:putative protein phosphatase 2C 43 [Nymphaea thermarum]